ncbi:MAG: prepilin peptidase [Chloroflexi bacterium]|jgi:leader peptidase (prepilin peptidase) / N-methyltransferase|nr:prepilin peptidase [Chloroflexota bacterium]MBT5628059.1 prepilin peptidase [Chloroflexota bacterium]
MEPGLLAILGLFVGGVLNVIVDRSPPHDYVDGVTAQGARPRSIKYWEWLPFLSAYGAMKNSRVPFPNHWSRYPLVELTSAALFGIAWYRISDPTWLFAISLILIAVLIALSFIDFETTYLPDVLVLPVLVVGLLVSFFIPDREWWQGLAGAAAGYAVFYPFAWIGDRLNRPVMGWGDVKLSAALGAILGLAPLLLGLYLGVLIGGFVALIVYAARIFGFNRVLIPYGPYLVAGGIVSMLYFRTIADWISTQL